ncbi:MAG: efflux RND transporter periplasmic adaptor subunit [Desulfobacteraceae bacterium]|nr:efflux RND transporter periplasmic adaptor subunit [Desulfobacteraceae bacterium]
MYTRILIAIIVVVVVAGALAAVKGLQIGHMVAQGKAFTPPAQPVTAIEVSSVLWETTLAAVGSIEAVQGVTVTAELPGKITRIVFEPGATVSGGQLLLSQDISVEKAQLSAAESEVVLAGKNAARARELLNRQLIPRADFDDRQAQLDQAVARVDNISAVIAKKTIRAPFSGRLGIRRVNLGEVLEPGQAIVTLQSLGSVFVNFQLPQQELPNLQLGLPVRISADGHGGEIMEGIITAVNPEVDPATRNIRAQATLANPGERLRPGMYTSVTVVLPARLPVLMIPATAVYHAPYGDSVFLVEDSDNTGDGSGQVLRQQFVQLGENRGDFIAVRTGLTAGQTVVSSGVFKLRNDQTVVVDNSLVPEFELKPQPENA